jgi:hypothetical protein
MFSLHRAHPVRTYRPRFQVLEDRTLLSTYVVDHLTDDGVGMGQSGSLRYCITNAVDGDTITFGVTGTINLTGALPGLYHNISINGPGANLLTLNGGHAFSVWATVAISGLTIANGFAVDDLGFYYGHVGGGIFNAGILSVSNCTVSANYAANGGGIFNSGIFDGGTLTISNSTIAGNEAWGTGNNDPGTGAGIFNDYGASLTVSNSTVAGNSSIAVSGGGVGGIASFDGATLTVSNTTITGNKAYGGDLAGLGSNGILNMRNSILAGNNDGYDNTDLWGQLTSSGYNLFGHTRDSGGFVNTDIIIGTGNPRLGPLQDNGGPTQTMAPLPGSRPLNAGDPAQLGVPDQRGVVRRGGVNIGAYQASASAFVLTAPDTVQSGMPFDVTVTAVDAFGQVALGYTGTLTFSTTDRDPNVVLPADYTFTASDQGTHTFSSGFTLITPGDQTIAASDTTDNSIVGSATVTVTGGGNMPGDHRGDDSMDALFALLATEWSRPGHPNGSLAFSDG